MGKKKRAETKKEISQEMQSEVVKPSEESFKKHLIPIFILLALSIGIYSNSLFNGFVYDDEFTIVNNTLIKDFNNLSKLLPPLNPLLQKEGEGVVDYFGSSGEMSYRPIVTLTYFIDYAIYGLKPYGYHLTNLLLHAMNGVLLYIFLFQLSAFSPQPSATFKPLYFSLFSSLIFVTHPVLTEAVNAISFREDLLCFLFFISALILYIAHRSLLITHCSKFKAFSLQFLSLSFYLLALLSKEMAITFPLIFFLYEWIYGKQPLQSPFVKGELKGVRGSLFNPYIIGYIVITFFYLYLRFFLFHNPVEEDISVWSLSERLMTIPYLISKYLLLLIAPLSLSADYVITPLKSLISIEAIVSIIVLISIFIIALKVGKRDKGISFGILFFLITLLPVYNIIPLYNPFAERYLYLPTVGFAIIIGSTLTWFIAHIQFNDMTGQGSWRIAHRSSLIAHSLLLIIIISIYSFAVIKRNKIWVDGYSLWTDTVRKMPESFKAHNGLGIVYDKQGRSDEAIKEYLTAIRFKPVYADAHNSLGNVYAKQGRIDEAIKEYKLALSIDPNYPEAHYNLGTAYGTSGLIDKAIEHFQIVLKLKPDFPEAHYNLGVAYHMNGLNDRAIEEYQIALRLKPDYTKAQDSLRKVLKTEK